MTARSSAGWGARGTRIGAGIAAALLLAAIPGQAGAQVRIRDLVFTLGGSVEDYSGNLSVVTVPVVDSANDVSSAVGEVAVRGQVVLLEAPAHSLELSFDGGLRQGAAMGFFNRDWTPREWVGSTELRFRQALGNWASLGLGADFRGRSVTDRTPMPLFLQAGYAIGRGTVNLVTRSIQGMTVDAEVEIERADYQAEEFLPQLDLLDRRAVGFELGARWGNAPSNLRVFGGLWWSEYEQQASFVPEDPFRRDRTVRAGVDWSYFGSAVIQIGVEGAINRSNSNRPEYDAVAVRALISVPLPASTRLNAFAVLTGKSYVHETDYARLVPGEEADNASQVYIQLVKPVAPNLDGAVRLAWTRAETDIGSQYYRRFGFSVELNYRPFGY